jgi:hypothetical protein
VPASISSLVTELADDVVLLSESYATWHLLAHPEKRAPHAAVLDRYAAFFGPTTLAHFQVVVVTTYQLTDRRSDTASVPQVLDLAKGVYSKVVADVDALLAPSRQVFDRLAAIRLKVYAHRDRNVGPEMVFREANLTPELIGSSVGLLQHAIDALAACCVPGCVCRSVFNRATHAADRAEAELRAILVAL